MTKKAKTPVIEPTTAALDNLFVSDLNVRKDKASIEDHVRLVASIRSVGLLQPLVVARHNEPGKPWPVIAGSRRLAALKHIYDSEDQGKAPDRSAIPIVMVDDEDSAVASHAENYARAPMSTRDLYLGFKQMFDQGSAIEDVAASYGMETPRVERILRLSMLAAPIFDAWVDPENRTVSDAQAQAFCLTNDQGIQLEVWQEFIDEGAYLSAEFIRKRIKQRLVGDDQVSQSLVKFVGIEAYKKAGGTLTQDLFGEDVVVHDPALMRQLAEDKINELVKARVCADYEFEEDGEKVADFTIISTPAAWNDRIHLSQIRRDAETEAELLRIEEALQDEDISDEDYKELNAKHDELSMQGTRLIPGKQRPLDIFPNITWQGGLDLSFSEPAAVVEDTPGDQPDEPGEEAVEAVEAEAAEPAVKLTQKATAHLKDMRAAAIHRGFFDSDETGAVVEDAHLALVFLMARRLNSYSSRADIMVHNMAGNVHRNEVVKLGAADADWIDEPDEIEAFRLFRQLTPLQINQVAAHILGQKVDGHLHQPGRRTLPEYLSAVRANPFMARRVIDLDAAFFALFKKKDILHFFSDALGDKLSATLYDKLLKAKQDTLRDYALKLFNPDDHPQAVKLMGLTKQTDLLRNWIPQWLRFDGLDVFHGQDQLDIEAAIETTSKALEEGVDKIVEEVSELEAN